MNAHTKRAMDAAEVEIKKTGVPEGTKIVQVWDADDDGVTLKFFKSVIEFDKANVIFTENGVVGNLDKKAVKAVTTAKDDQYVMTYRVWRLKPEARRRSAAAGK